MNHFRAIGANGRMRGLVLGLIGVYGLIGQGGEFGGGEKESMRFPREVRGDGMGFCDVGRGLGLCE